VTACAPVQFADGQPRTCSTAFDGGCAPSLSAGGPIENAGAFEEVVGGDVAAGVAFGEDLSGLIFGGGGSAEPRCQAEPSSAQVEQRAAEEKDNQKDSQDAQQRFDEPGAFAEGLAYIEGDQVEECTHAVSIPLALGKKELSRAWALRSTTGRLGYNRSACAAPVADAVRAGTASGILSMTG
jgi:hypothetical protein